MPVIPQQAISIAQAILIIVASGYALLLIASWKKLDSSGKLVISFLCSIFLLVSFSMFQRFSNTEIIPVERSAVREPANRQVVEEQEDAPEDEEE